MVPWVICLISMFFFKLFMFSSLYENMAFWAIGTGRFFFLSIWRTFEGGTVAGLVPVISLPRVPLLVCASK